MTSLQLASIDDATAYGYDSLPGPADLYHTSQWLKMEEHVGIARSFNVLGFAAGDLTHAAAGTWGLVVEPDAFWPFMRVDNALSALLDERRYLRTAQLDATLAGLLPGAYLGALRGGTTRMLSRPGLDGPAQRQAIGEVLAGVETMARAEGLRSAAFLYVPPEDAALREVLRERGYAQFRPEFYVSVLPVTTFSDYTAGLSLSRRRNVIWERNKLARAGVTVTVEPLTSELSWQMLPLEAELYRKYGHAGHPTQMARVLHEWVMKEFGDDAKVICAYGDGALRGYAAFIQRGTTIYSRDGGFDYTWQQKLPLYNETGYYRAVELAAEAGAHEINYSYSSEHTKAARGCELQPRWTYVKAFDEQAAAELTALSAALARTDTGEAATQPLP